MHGIIIIDKPENYNGAIVTGCDSSVVPMVETGHALSLQPKQPQQSKSSQQYDPQKQPHPRFRNQGKNTISAMVGSYKSAVTKWCNENKLPFDWQSRFPDHIIRDNDVFFHIRNYIMNNPANWKEDKFFSL